MPYQMKLKRCAFGSLTLLQYLDDRALDWLCEQTITEPWQWISGGIAVEPRMAQDILDAFREAGGKVVA